MGFIISFLKFKGGNDDAKELDFVCFALKTIVRKNELGHEVRIALTAQFKFKWIVKHTNLRSALNYVNDVLFFIINCASEFDTQPK
jgi:hypothetical protein